ncbi:MAG: DUF1844 domain-containing protein [Acidimicrobiia bacterium]|nr:DUF1844 domain-containing protein [Acidimicrobiia bacterium]MBP8182227.1 DUF1844 domain-containing protein [Acidimicrobiia bacterium]
MSELWTPYGEHPVKEGPVGRVDSPAHSDGTGVPPASDFDADRPLTPQEEAEAAAAMAQLRDELMQTPVADIVANHAIGLWQLAVVHLGADGGGPPNLSEAKLAIDAMEALVNKVKDKLGENGEALGAALSQLQMAYVQVSQGQGVPPTDSDS